jgi:hypothetical protein
VKPRFFAAAALGIGLVLSPAANAMQAGGAKSTKAKVSTRPSDQDIANAKSQGLVWVDTDARVYYKQGDLYGKTKRGKFALEDDAKKEGIFESKQVANRRSKKRPDQSGIDDSIETHSSTPPKQ